jgi:hypothetical protein
MRNAINFLLEHQAVLEVKNVFKLVSVTYDAVPLKSYDLFTYMT